MGRDRSTDNPIDGIKPHHQLGLKLLWGYVDIAIQDGNDGHAGHSLPAFHDGV